MVERLGSGRLLIKGQKRRECDGGGTALEWKAQSRSNGPLPPTLASPNGTPLRLQALLQQQSEEKGKRQVVVSTFQQFILEN